MHGTIHLHKKSRKFSIRKGVRQRGTISLKSFASCLEEQVLRKPNWERTVIRVNRMRQLN